MCRRGTTSPISSALASSAHFPPCRSLCEPSLLYLTVIIHQNHDPLTGDEQVLRQLSAENTACGGGKGAVEHAVQRATNICVSALPAHAGTSAHHAAATGMR